MSLISNRRILIVDDNEAIHSDFRKILISETKPSKLADAKAALFGKAKPIAAPAITFEVDSALQGEEGLAKVQAALAENRPYSLAFVDMRMPPGWDGLQTIQRFWDIDPNIQIVICSAFSDYSWNEITEKLGLTDRLLILRKPFDPSEATQLAAALSEKWALRREARLRMDQLEQMVLQRTAELSKLALNDKLTGLANRTAFVERLSAAVRNAQNDGSSRFALMFLDFDRFKHINDSLGHEAGDQVLQTIATRITATLQLAGITGEQVLAARLGGDEFTILLEGIGSNEAIKFTETLAHVLNAPIKLAQREIFCTASIGITDSDGKYASAGDALRDADTAMYEAKAAGKARCIVFDRTMHERAAARLELEHDLRLAIERHEFCMFYQPLISLQDGKLKGFEALARWNHPTRGLLSPGEFISCCEDIGLMYDLGQQVLEMACRQLKDWTTRIPDFADLSMSVNLSASQLGGDALPAMVKRIIEETGIQAGALTLEITESLMMRDTAAAIETLRQIRDLGVHLHLDDFGTGYSSLSTMHLFPIDGLKIDRAFIRNLIERHDYMAVVQAIVTLARNLGLQLIAEGIETTEQIDILISMDVNLVQGFYFHAPASVAVAEAYMRKQLDTRQAA